MEKKKEKRISIISSSDDETANKIDIIEGYINYDKNFLCTVCSKIFKSTRRLILHQRQAHSLNFEKVTDYPCDECDKTFSSSCNFYRHKRMVHKRRFGRSSAATVLSTELDNVKCETTTQPRFPRVEADGTVYQCSCCPMVFTRQHSLWKHEKWFHAVENIEQPVEKVACSICEATFSNETNLKIHMTKLHLAPTFRLTKITFKCNDCGELFKKKHRLEEHVVTHLWPDRKKMLLDLLPPNYKYKIKCMQPSKDEQFFAKFTFHLRTLQDGQQWFQDFQDRNKVLFRCASYRHSVKDNVLKKSKYRCYHNSRPISSAVRCRSKHTNCQANMLIAITKDPSTNKLTACVRLNHAHNHPFREDEYFLRRPLSVETRAKLLKLFEDGCSPIVAYRTYESEMTTTCESAYGDARMASVMLPSMQTVFNLYYRYKAGLANVDRRRKRNRKQIENVRFKNVVNLDQSHFEDLKKPVAKVDGDNLYENSCNVSENACKLCDNEHDAVIKPENMADVEFVVVYDTDMVNENSDLILDGFDECQETECVEQTIA